MGRSRSLQYFPFGVRPCNLNWTLGPFKYVVATPVFHRWHHTSQEEGCNTNFAGTFPVLDMPFGTFRMPESRLPDH